MFVRHITEKDIFENGFILNPLTNETFSKQKIDTECLSTYMQIWIDVNSYRYRVITDREGKIEDGVILTKDILKELVTEFFNKDIESFIERNISTLYPNWNKIKKQCFIENIKKLEPEKKREKMLELFGEL
jgi:Mg2+/Co2+ transporter CorC